MTYRVAGEITATLNGVDINKQPKPKQTDLSLIQKTVNPKKGDKQWEP